MTNIFFKIRKHLSWFSTISFALALFFCFVMKPNYGVEFEGGYVIEVTSVSTDLQSLLDDKLKDNVVSISHAESKDVIKLNSSISSGDIDLVKSSAGDKLLSVDSISGSYGAAMKSNSVFAIVMAMVAMTLYLSIRYNALMAGATMIALAHDLVIAFGFVIFLRIEINAMTVGALMTIIGYSVNDSVVTLDKIKELVLSGDDTPIESAVRKILPRSVMTSVSTLLVLIALLLLGGDSIYGFSLVLTMGVIFGTLSSLIVVSSIIKKAATNNPSLLKIPSKASEFGDV